MAYKLVIVESPTKAKTISKFLGKDYKVESSFGHIRDLPKTKMGIDTDGDFTPHYVVPTKARKRATELKNLAKKASEVYFATDPDREGEAISWHLAHILGINPEKAKRVAFHEITKDAILKEFEKPDRIQMGLVDAQQARRVLDRLVGYELSPFLWKKVARGLSAGRVQSVAVRFIVEREREIEAFKADEYWTIKGLFSHASEEATSFEGGLQKIDGKKLTKLGINNEARSKEILGDLTEGAYTISSIEEKEKKRNPFAPFITSTLQQEANRKLHFSAKQTMRIAQELYEGVSIGTKGNEGLITYMRTDSYNLSAKFTSEAQHHIKESFGDKYALSKPRPFGKKSKLAQEAHEAVRPTLVSHTPESIKEYLSPRQYKLYDLIWRRAVASQMQSATMKSTGINIENKGKEHEYTFRATGLQVVFDGFLKLYPESINEGFLPEMKEQDPLKLLEIKPEQHFTEPPARYSEASLVKALEENGIGRPSTYAPIMSIIVDRGYVTKDERKFKPTDIGSLVNDLLVEHFNDIVDKDFTAELENDLDAIAHSKKEWIPLIKSFYSPFKKNLEVKTKEVDKKALTEEATDEVCDKCSSSMVIKLGRFGKFLACSGYPDCKNTKPLDEEGNIEEPEKIDKKCSNCGKPMQIKHGRYGKFLGCSGYPECKTIEKIENGTGVTCTECGKGEIVERKSKRGRTFFSCNQYPKCKNALWSKPTGDKCPKCSALVVYAKDEAVQCSKKECDYKKEA